MLHKVNNDTCGKGYCGPYAIAAVTGHPLSVVLDTCRAIRFGSRLVMMSRPPRIGQMNKVEVSAVLSCLIGGAIREWVDLTSSERGAPSFAAWLNSRNRDDENRTAIVHIGHGRGSHVVAVSGRRACDTHSRGIPVHVADIKGRRKVARYVLWIN